MSGPIDPAHLAEEWAIDDEILQNMAAGGDLSHVVREINVQFVGSVGVRLGAFFTLLAMLLAAPAYAKEAVQAKQFGQFTVLEIVQEADPELERAIPYHAPRPRNRLETWFGDVDNEDLRVFIRDDGLFLSIFVQARPAPNCFQTHTFQQYQDRYGEPGIFGTLSKSLKKLIKKCPQMKGREELSDQLRDQKENFILAIEHVKTRMPEVLKSNASRRCSPPDKGWDTIPGAIPCRLARK